MLPGSFFWLVFRDPSVFLRAVREDVHPAGRPAPPPAHPHRREALQVPGVRENLHRHVHAAQTRGGTLPPFAGSNNRALTRVWLVLEFSFLVNKKSGRMNICIRVTDKSDFMRFRHRDALKNGSLSSAVSRAHWAKMEHKGVVILVTRFFKLMSACVLEL